jgi:hypothetical protein
MLWRQPFNDFEALTSGWGISRLEGQCPTLAIGHLRGLNADG